MTEAEVAWLAALVDGEGSIMLIHRQPTTNRRPHFRAQVGIYNTDRRLIDRIVEVTGIDRVYTHTRAPKENHKKTSYRWNLVADEARTLLPLLIPWLVCKKEQAELLMLALDIKTNLTPRKGEKALTVPERDRLRDRLVEIQSEISGLNRKGRLVTNKVSQLP